MPKNIIFGVIMAWQRRGMESIRSLIADGGILTHSNFSVISASEVGLTPDSRTFVSCMLNVQIWTLCRPIHQFILGIVKIYRLHI